MVARTETNFRSDSVSSFLQPAVKIYNPSLLDRAALFRLVAQFVHLGTFYAPQNDSYRQYGLVQCTITSLPLQFQTFIRTRGQIKFRAGLKHARFVRVRFHNNMCPLVWFCARIYRLAGKYVYRSNVDNKKALFYEDQKLQKSISEGRFKRSKRISSIYIVERNFLVSRKQRLLLRTSQSLQRLVLDGNDEAQAPLVRSDGFFERRELGGLPLAGQQPANQVSDMQFRFISGSFDATACSRERLM